MLPGHRLVGFVLDLHDLAGLFVPLGPLAGLGVLELGAVSPESLNDFLLGGLSIIFILILKYGQEIPELPRYQ